jgi:subtilisin family serine protease
VPDVLKQRQYGPAAFGPPIKDAVFGPAPYLPIAALGVPSLGCDALPAGALNGQVALIERGVCPFSLKVFNAQQAGAIAAIIYNSQAGGEAVVLMAAGPHANEITIPAISVPRSVGLGMIDWYGKNDGAARVQIDPRARVIDQTPDVLAPFSSRGPTFQHSLKPDVVAPGVNILSSGFASGEGIQKHLGFGLVSGTSMATPHVAGSAALLIAQQPGLSVSAVKSLLISNVDVLGSWSGLVVSNGRLNVYRAALANTPIAITLTNPPAGSTYTAPASVTIEAGASSSNGAITRVDFYANSTLIASDTTSPYSITWSGVPAGAYTLTAKATDTTGATGVSTGRTITVNTGGGGTSPDGTRVPPATQIIDDTGAVWTLNGQSILRNGQATGSATTITWCGGRIHVFALDNQWWRWVGGWTPVGTVDPCGS